MATAPSKSTSVVVGMQIDDKIVPVGVLLVERAFSGETDKSIGRFRYAPSYLKQANAVPLDPVHMPLQEGEFRFATMGGLPSAIRDAAPDNWGRTLVRRYYYARGHAAPLAEVDYLLAAPADRSGNLHFAADFRPDGTPDWNKRALQPQKLPEMLKLREHVITVLRDPTGTLNHAYPEEIDALLTGSGGARPKVNLHARDGSFLIKMSNPVNDRASVSRLEEASMKMAAEVGIKTAEVSSPGADFLAVKRFDRVDGKPLQMVSAMTVLGADDAPFKFQNWSYPLLATELNRWSANPKEDKRQLFCCMVLRAMLSDGDDHPRNYALIREATGSAGGSTLGQWRLSPMYDCVVGRGVGSKATESAMVMGVSGTEISEENMLSNCEAFGLERDEAKKIMADIQKAVLERFPAILDACKVSAQDKALALAAVAPLSERRELSPMQKLMSQMDSEQKPGMRPR